MKKPFDATAILAGVLVGVIVGVVAGIVTWAIVALLKSKDK